MSDNLELFEKFLKMGADINVKDPIFSKSILNVSIYYNVDNVAKYIINNYPQFINMGSDIDGCYQYKMLY